MQNTSSRPGGVKGEESKQNAHYLELLGGQIAAVERQLSDVAKRQAEVLQSVNQPEVKERVRRKLAAVGIVHKLLLAPIQADNNLVRYFLRWRFRRMSVTSKLLTDDINKCFAKFRRTMLILFNRRLMNRLSSHFHFFVRQCTLAGYEQNPETKHLQLASKGSRVYRLLVSNSMQHTPRIAGTRTAVDFWRAYVRRVIRAEHDRKRAAVMIV